MIVWDDSLKTGNEVVDTDHCGLVALLNKMESDMRSRTSAESIAASIRSLHAYVQGHFVREEAHMLAVSCLAYAKNQAEHRRFAERLDGWIARLDQEGPSAGLAFDVYHGTGNWFASHIRGTDCELRDCPHLHRS